MRMRAGKENAVSFFRNAGQKTVLPGGKHQNSLPIFYL